MKISKFEENVANFFNANIDGWDDCFSHFYESYRNIEANYAKKYIGNIEEKLSYGEVYNTYISTKKTLIKTKNHNFERLTEQLLNSKRHIIKDISEIINYEFKEYNKTTKLELQKKENLLEVLITNEDINCELKINNSWCPNNVFYLKITSNKIESEEIFSYTNNTFNYEFDDGQNLFSIELVEEQDKIHFIETIEKIIKNKKMQFCNYDIYEGSLKESIIKFGYAKNMYDRLRMFIDNIFPIGNEIIDSHFEKCIYSEIFKKTHMNSKTKKYKK